MLLSFVRDFVDITPLFSFPVFNVADSALSIGCVFLVTGADLAEGRTPSINAAVLGLTVGEIFSMLIALICLYIHLYPDASVLSLQNICPSSAVYRDLLGMALPLTANRIVLNILQSIEAVSIPQKLLLYGYDTTTALSVYGVLTGMAMPMIFFPNALTSSVAVLLLPTISENHAKGDRKPYGTTLCVP